MHETNKRVRKAFEKSDPDYIEKCFAQRNPGPESLGSQFFSKMSVADMLTADWEEIVHPDVMAPAKAFRTSSLGGRIGVAEVARLCANSVAHIRPSPKGTGEMEMVVERTLDKMPEVEFTTLLLGPGDEGTDLANEEVVWTFFPGDPVRPSELKVDAQENISVKAARALGFKWAKILVVP
jgi:hypothetical protein